MRVKAPILISILIFALFADYPFQVNAQPQPLQTFTGTLCRSYTPTPGKIAQDLSDTFCFTSKKISWRNPAGDNLTFNIPTLAGTSLTVSTLQNSSTIDYHITASFSGRSLTGDIFLKQKLHNYKITIKGTITGSVSTFAFALPFVGGNTLSWKGNTILAKGQLGFDWSDSPTGVFTNSTKTLTWTIGNSFSLDPIALDGNNNCQATTQTCTAGNFVNLAANDIIIVSETCNSENCVTPTDSEANVYTLRKSLLFGVSTTTNIANYYTVRAASGALTSVTCKKTDGLNRLACAVIAISGASTTTIFDPHSSLPATNKGSGSATTDIWGTSNANDFVMSFVGWEGNPTVTRPTGWTTCNGAGSSTAPATADRCSYLITSTLTAQDSAWSWAGGALQWGEIVDAICQAGDPCSNSATTTTVTTSVTSTVTNNLSDPPNYLWLLLIPLILMIIVVASKKIR